VYFFDTPDLALDAHGVVVRARRVQRRGDDSVVKLRLPADPGAVTKVAPAETFQAVAQGRAFLAEKGLDLSGEQQTKTKTALRYYARSG
jgi:hypothetical protein